MASTIEEKKNILLAKATAAAVTLVGATQETTARHLVATLYGHVPPADVAEKSPRDLCGAALSLWHFAERRRPGQAKIRVHNPDLDKDGWSSRRTIVEIVNDDMPFLVDSVTGAINSSNRIVHLVIHPILTVERTSDGRLAAIDGVAAGLRESWMQIEITPESDREGLARLTESLAGVLADVRAAVGDWQKMRNTLRGLLEDLSAAPPPVPADEAAEVRDFLRWLDDDNFTFLGYREYPFRDTNTPGRPPLGILSDAGYALFGGLRDFAALPPDVQDFLRRRELLLISKSNRRSTVHRTAHMDAIGLRRFDADGEVVGIRVFLGLYTSLAYNRSPRSIPLLRLKTRHILERSGLSPASHDGKALLHILESYPRDELFQTDEETLYATAIGILNLQERQRIALFIRHDPLERFVSCLVFAPRERYDTALRQLFTAILERASHGKLSAFYTHVGEGPLVRVQFIIRTTRGAVPAVDATALEKELAEAGRTWSDRLEEAAIAELGEAAARALLKRFSAFPLAYQARTEAAEAVADLRRLDAALDGSPLEVALAPQPGAGMPGQSPASEDRGGTPILRLYRAGEPVALSDVLPILENLALRVVAEEPFRIETPGQGAVWLHAFALAGAAVAGSVPAFVRRRFEEALVAAWTGRIENDGFNRLVLTAGLEARQIVILRLYSKLLRQAGSAFSQAYMEDTLVRHPELARRLVQLFEIRLDPARAFGASLATIGEVQAIDHALDRVESLDEDRIVRNYLTLILKTTRTNYYQKLPNSEPKPYLAVKLASSAIDFLPRPRPLYEIFVYSPRVEAVHMRAGPVARGGIRWSDRKEDFRSEILGLMKAQTVKNAVIVPVGSKGGFVVKDGRGAPASEGVECYKILIRGLLDLTDNIVPTPRDTPEEPPRGGVSKGRGDPKADGEGRHRVVPPPDVVRHDGDDPYLVVAADKGTATFSDYANAIAEEYGFWLGDAFASGGSAGYDHKAMGITSRGAFELVKRHFRELGRNIEESPFTVVGVGDMSGDVFGNGMLRSRQIRLLAAFDHRHVFVDPDPDPAASFAERARLFLLPRSSWADYDPALISAGGGVFERSAKAIAISPEMKRVFGLAADTLAPAELIHELLKAEIDLLWFGGIGTFVKGAQESHAEVGDRANDALRVNGDELRAKVVGEGANLAVTERGRTAFALRGGRIDTDAIDNSAGVDTSDHEVNFKILVDGAIAAGLLPREEREPLLAGVKDEMAALVLRDNTLQGEALSVAEARGAAALDRQVRLMRELERGGHLDRALEFLPDDETLAQRAARRRGLMRPELAVLLAYAKMTLYDELLASDLPDSPDVIEDREGYFPAALRARLGPRIALHPLHREIAATVLTNDLVNRAGLTFVSDMRARTGRTAPEIVRAYLIVREIFGLKGLWAEIEALDNRVAADTQLGMLLAIAALVEHAAAWLLHNRRVEIGRECARLTPAVNELAAGLSELLPPGDSALTAERAARLVEAGVPAPLAARTGALPFLASAAEIAALAEQSGQKLGCAARVYYGAGARFALDDLRAAALRLPAETPWQKLAVEAMIDDVYGLQADFASRILTSPCVTSPDPLAAWAAERAALLAPAEMLATELRAAATPDLAMLVVAGRQLRHALG
ncbi:MAG: NAD-glutamate dehydrogenase [Stellaceae bacterium]